MQRTAEIAVDGSSVLIHPCPVKDCGAQAMDFCGHSEREYALTRGKVEEDTISRVKAALKDTTPETTFGELCESIEEALAGDYLNS